MALAYRPFDPPSRPILRLGAVLALLSATSGCGTFSAWRAANDSSLSRGPTDEEVGDDRNLMAKWLTPKVGPNSGIGARSPLILGSNGYKPMKGVANPEADKEYQGAEQLFHQNKLVEAEAAFQKIAKNRKGTPWGEKAQFYLAETQFQRGLYVKAHDSFETHFATYPGTQYMDKLVSREFAIAQAWLAQSDPEAKPEQQLPWTAHFDSRQPMIDVRGHALRVLEHVRQHEPTGPLADDALLQIADQHMKMREYELAAEYYDHMATDHPQSPYVQRAQLASIDARMKAYEGPEYDAGGLEKARETIKQTMAAFPDRPASNEKLYHTLDLINDSDAERTYIIGDYYRRIGKVASAEFYFGKVRHRWPRSEWAAKSKTQLAALAKMPRTESLPSKIMSSPGSVDPYSSGMGGMGAAGGAMGGMPGMNMGGPGGMN